MMKKSGFVNKADLAQATQELMDKYDTDNSNTVSTQCWAQAELMCCQIDFTEFLKMMAHKPFVGMVPTEARDFLLMSSYKARCVACLPVCSMHSPEIAAAARSQFHKRLPREFLGWHGNYFVQQM